MTSRQIASLFGVIAWFGICVAHAEPRVVRYTFIGTVTSVSDPFPSPHPPQVGQRIEGSVTHEVTGRTAVGATGPGGQVTRTDWILKVPPSQFSFHNVPFTFVASTSAFTTMNVEVGNGTNSALGAGLVDTYVVVGGFPRFNRFALRLEDTTQSVFVNRSIPQSIDLHDFDRNRLEYYQIVNGAQQLVLTASIDNIIGGEQATRRIDVAPTGVDTPTCGNDANPCRSIGHALDLAVNGDMLFVETGIYGDLNHDGDFLDPGEERPNLALGCLICVTREVVIFAHGSTARPIIDAGGALPVATVLIDADHVILEDFVIRGGTRGGVRIGPHANNTRLRGIIAESNLSGGGAPPAAGIDVDSRIGTIDIGHVVAEGNDVGFAVTTAATGRVVLARSTAARNQNAGFSVTGSNLLGSSQNVLDRVKSVGNGVGFILNGANHRASFSTALNNAGPGFSVIGPSHDLVRTSAISNGGAGLSFSGNSQSIVLTSTNVFGNLGAGSGTQHNCGIVNASGRLIDASTTFFGKANGQGADPGDAAGPGTGCDIGAGSTTKVTPFAAKAFLIE